MHRLWTSLNAPLTVPSASTPPPVEGTPLVDAHLQLCGGNSLVSRPNAVTLHHRSIDPLQILEGGEVHHQPSPPIPQLDLHPGVQVGGQQFLQFQNTGLG